MYYTEIRNSHLLLGKLTHTYIHSMYINILLFSLYLYIIVHHILDSLYSTEYLYMLHVQNNRLKTTFT